MRRLKPNIIGALLLSVCMLTLAVVRADDSLDVTIDEPSDNIIYDNSGNPYVIVSDGDNQRSFDCSVDGGGNGTMHYNWNFGSGDPSTSGDQTDSGYGPVSFTEGTTVHVDVTEENDGNTCNSGSDDITVSYVTFTFNSQGQDTDGNDVYFYVPDDAEADADGNIEVRCDIVISADSGLTGVDLGTLSTDNYSDYFVDEDGNTITEANIGDDGTITVTLVTSSDLIDNDVNVYMN